MTSKMDMMTKTLAMRKYTKVMTQLEIAPLHA